MTLYAGIDIGTSGVKVALVDGADNILAEAATPTQVDRPHPGWSQQHPDVWWQATCSAFDRLAATHPQWMARVKAVGLSGQMLGPVLLDKSDRPTHPCILWNDQRAQTEAGELLSRIPDIGLRTAGCPDPGLAAPKLLWLAGHHPRALEGADILMLPKDYVRLRLTGERASDPTDAAGTLLFDCRAGAWDSQLAEAAGWDLARLPPLVPSHARAGTLLANLTNRWGMKKSVPVAAGAGDNMASALGVGVSAPGDAVVTIGTSGVLGAVDARYHPAPHAAVLTNPHAAPDTFLSMGVVMSATQSLDWIGALTGKSVAELATAVDAMVAEGGIGASPVMRPSLTGIRTPHNRPDAGAAISGINASADAASVAYGVMEGVAFQFFDCLKAQRAAGVPASHFSAVGGGSRNRLWVGLIATLFGQEFVLPQSSSASAAIGAARLASIACGDFGVAEALSRKPAHATLVEPDLALNELLSERYARFAALPM
jgi:xylulokinase